MAEQGYQLTAGQMKAIRETVRRVRLEHGGGNSTPQRTQVQRDICVVLDAALAVATNSMTGGTSGLATVLTWSTTDEEYSESDDQVTVWNHSESTAHAIDTFGTAKWMDGHWWFFGDCEAMADREGA